MVRRYLSPRCLPKVKKSKPSASAEEISALQKLKSDNEVLHTEHYRQAQTIIKLEKTVERLMKEQNGNNPPQAIVDIQEQLRKSDIKMRKFKVKATIAKEKKE